ncbi:hypothetical protein RRG08_043291 [Elysia crispata]|uniref:Vesicular, overexpressed in cancer, prosurvival protein 1 n=1 Tax=Elysia crispata TaxID=231223 RepID=A0AAE0XY24_9GAST|nr:hypothetical protein RRG08_043291 [Elysia crispata]
METNQESKCLLTQSRLWPVLSASLRKVILVNVIVLSGSLPGSCNGRRERSEDDNNKYWYQLWYFWLIVSLFLVGVLLLVFIYCKQQAKQARLEGMGQIRAQMVLPPAYDEPVHLPPPYSVAAAVTDCVQPTRLSHQLQHSSFGYLPHNIADAIPNERAESAPPPYSPPPYSAEEDSQDDRNRPRDVTSLPSRSSTPGSTAARPSHGSSSEQRPVAQANDTNSPGHFNRSFEVHQEPPGYISLPGAMSDDFQERSSVPYRTYYHNSISTSQVADNSNSVYSLSQSQLSINLRRSSSGMTQSMMRQPYDLSANMMCRTSNDAGRTSVSYVPCTNQQQPADTEPSSRPQSVSASSRLCAAALANTFQNERLGLRNSVSSAPNRLTTSLSYNMSDSAPPGGTSHRLYRRNAPSSGKTQNKSSTSTLRSDGVTNVASSSTFVSNANISRTRIANRTVSQQLSSSQNSRLSENHDAQNPLTTPKSP